MKRLFILFILLSNIGFSQDNPYHFQVTGAEDTVIYLANYYGEKLYYADTARADNSGNFSFKMIEKENEGKYAVVVPGPKFFEVVIADDEKIVMKTDTSDLTGNMKVEQSKNNTIMYDYVHYLAGKKERRQELVKESEEKEGDEKATAKLKEEYSALNQEVLKYQKKVISENPNQFAAHEIRMSLDPEVPEALKEDREKGYYWFKKHYFDNMDLNDDRIVRTPLYHNKLVSFLNNTVIQSSDTLIKTIDQLVAKLAPASELFKYTVHYITYNFETSKIMGLDEVFVHMVDKYYKTGLATWMDDEKLKNIIEKADGKRSTLIGNIAPELILADTTGKNWISTYRDVSTDYVVLYFYDPDCGHCKKETPKLVEFYNGYEDKDLSIYAVSSDYTEKWNKFIKKNEMNFFNVAIPKEAYESAEFATSLITSKKTNYKSLKYTETFDVISTPKILVLDKDRIIRAKDIGVEQIGDFLERFKKVALEENKESN